MIDTHIHKLDEVIIRKGDQISKSYYALKICEIFLNNKLLFNSHLAVSSTRRFLKYDSFTYSCIE